MTVARLQRYALFLAGFEYSIEYKNTTQHGNADGFSRLPLKKACDKEVVDPVEIFQVSQIEVLPVNADMLRQATQRDPVLSRVMKNTKQGWPAVAHDGLRFCYYYEHACHVRLSLNLNRHVWLNIVVLY